MMICLSFRKLLSVAMIRQDKVSVLIVLSLTVATYAHPKTDTFNAVNWATQPRKVVSDMEYKDMTYGKAIDTIEHIEERTDEEIVLAIYRILNMTTIMAVNKDNLVKIIRWLFDKCYEVKKGGAE